MNFSIIVPGGCTSHCGFCFWDRNCPSLGKEDYLETLDETLSAAPSGMSLSITGGEPTESAMLADILKIIRKHKAKFSRVVLTTTATKLGSQNLLGVVDHINISRHAVDETANSIIFGNKNIPTAGWLTVITDKMNQYGIDVTLSAVLTKHIDTKEGILRYIELAKRIGASAVCFRKMHTVDCTLDPSPVEAAFAKEYKITHEETCPVCRITERLIAGMKTYWHASKFEPSNALGEPYEYILHPSGLVTTDWAGKNIVRFKQPKPTAVKTNIPRWKVSPGTPCDRAHHSCYHGDSNSSSCGRGGC